MKTHGTVCEVCRRGLRLDRSLASGHRCFESPFADGRYSRLIFPGLDGLHSKRADLNPNCALDRAAARSETLPRAGAAHLFVPHDHLHLRDVDSVLPKLTCIKPLHLREERARDFSGRPRRTAQASFARLSASSIVASAVLITLYVWAIIERHPRTDDASRACQCGRSRSASAWTNR